MDEIAARELFPEGNPLGRSVAWLSDTNRGTVVGVVGNVRKNSPQVAAPPHIYMPLTAGVTSSLHVLARTEDDPRRHASALKQVIADVDRAIVVDRVSAMNDLLSAARARERLYATLLGVFAACAFLIALGGIHATVKFTAEGAVRDLGVRAALGARPSELFVLVVRRAMVLTALGCGIGVAGAFAANRLLEGLLFNVDPGEPLTYGVVLGLLCLASLGAGLLPGLRATRADPMVVLRTE